MFSGSTPLRMVHYLDTIRLRYGGVVRFVLDVCKDLANRGHHVTLLTQNDEDVPDAWKLQADHNPHSVCIGPRRVSLSLFDRQVDRSLTRLLREADALHLHKIWDTYHLHLIHLARKLDKPYIMSTHGMLNDWALGVKTWRKRWYLKLFSSQLLNKAACVHCATEEERRQVDRWIQPGNLTVIPLSFDRSSYETLPGAELITRRFPFLADGRPMVLTLGRLHPVKRVELLIEAMAALRDGGVAARLVIAGPHESSGYVDRLRQTVRSVNLGDAVEFVGTVVGEEKLSLYQAADVFVLPSLQENFGLVLAEALACRTPVVTTRCVDTWPEIEAAGGRIVEPQATAIAAAVGQLLRDGQLREALGHQGRQSVFDWLDPNKVLDGYERMYRDVIDSSSRKSHLPTHS